MMGHWASRPQSHAVETPIPVESIGQRGRTSSIIIIIRFCIWEIRGLWKEREGYRVESSRSGAEALLILCHSPPQCSRTG